MLLNRTYADVPGNNEKIDKVAFHIIRTEDNTFVPGIGGSVEGTAPFLCRGLSTLDADAGATIARDSTSRNDISSVPSSVSFFCFHDQCA